MLIASRIVVGLYGLIFAALGFGFWVAPERAAARFAVEPLGPVGLSTLRGDFGGVFLGLAVLCLVGVWSRRRGLLTAAAIVLGAIILGRLLGAAMGGGAAGLVPNLPVEIVGLVALVLCVRALPRSGEPSRPLRALAMAGVIVAMVLGLGAVALNMPAVQDGLLQRVAAVNIRRDNATLVTDPSALRVALCGTSAPLPSPKRAKACVAVMAGGKIWIVDSGPESTKNLMQWGVPLDRTAGVLLTHFHSDHIGDLGELNLQTWVPGRPAPLAVYGGPGVEQVVDGFNLAYAQDRGYRTAHHTAAIMPPATSTLVARPIALPAATQGQPRTAVIHDDGQMRITAIETNHAPVAPAYAYRFDYRGRSLVVTGDTTAYAPLTAASRGADIFMSEALNREMVRTMEATARDVSKPRIAHIMHDIQDYHISPKEAAQAANQAGARMLVLYHLIPAPDNAILKSIFTRGLDDARQGDWDLAEDGSLYTLPVGSTEIRIGRVPK
ncbi:MBL fold metallo-hydrolase [Phenylobacterium kunshanense]|uniref:MBL fold metallo-hydrolase n=1 Tax=Phenylobacterium kunshanense TaxID=1445034 RepID=A0A328B8S5_9CAUL|nr:MBL fold metallo-hydrolase [Phenylobacterium kunshanense]RAK62821.1 MBL fold metallo-hydrolase [Phenylobacterium kunshanense]